MERSPLAMPHAGQTTKQDLSGAWLFQREGSLKRQLLQFRTSAQAVWEEKEMKQIADRVRPSGVKVHASAEFTRDMAENLCLLIQGMSEGERLVVSFTNAGVWAVTRQGLRVFIGSTEVFTKGERDGERPHVQ